MCVVTRVLCEPSWSAATCLNDIEFVVVIAVGNKNKGVIVGCPGRQVGIAPFGVGKLV